MFCFPPELYVGGISVTVTIPIRATRARSRYANTPHTPPCRGALVGVCRGVVVKPLLSCGPRGGGGLKAGWAVRGHEVKGTFGGRKPKLGTRGRPVRLRQEAGLTGRPQRVIFQARLGGGRTGKWKVDASSVQEGGSAAPGPGKPDLGKRGPHEERGGEPSGAPACMPPVPHQPPAQPAAKHRQGHPAPARPRAQRCRPPESPAWLLGSGGWVAGVVAR